MSHLAQAVAANTVAINIGGIPIGLRSDDPAFRQMLEERYSGFLFEGGLPDDGPGLHFDVHLVSPGELQADEEVRVWRDEHWHFKRGDFRADWDEQSGRGRMYLELNPYALNSILRIVHTLILARRGGFLLHAASVIRNGSAYIFSGVSGAGKTTISRLAPCDLPLLTDEISYVRRTGSGYTAWGTPFYGELGRAGENVSAPIQTLYFLNKGPENRIDAIEPARAVRMLLRNILFFSQDSTLVHRVFESACQFVDRMPVRELTFVPDARVWELVA